MTTPPRDTRPPDDTTCQVTGCDTIPSTDCGPGQITYDGITCVDDDRNVETTVSPETTAVTTTTTCQEDMDCWDCTTMGNLGCGPAPTTTTALVAVAPPPLPATGVSSADLIGGGLLAIIGGIGIIATTRRKRT